MTIDHIGCMFPNTPVCFRWEGRIAAPIFMIALIEGMDKTSNRKKYIVRIGVLNVIVVFLDFCLDFFGEEQIQYPSNILKDWFAVAVIIMILEWSRSKYGSMKKGIIIILSWQIIMRMILWFVPIDMTSKYYFECLFGLILYDGYATLLGILTIIFYFQKANKKRCIIIYAVCSIGLPILNWLIPHFFGLLLCILPEGPLEIPMIRLVDILKSLFDLLGFRTGYYLGEGTALLDDYQIGMILALPLLMCYNGKRGKGFKYLFYFYYPIHISLLAMIRLVLIS